MGMTADDYLAQQQALLPQGQAWPRDSGATLTKLLQAMAEEFARLDGRIAQLLEETDPRTTSELLADWERVAGLPDACARKSVALGAGTLGGIGFDRIASFARATTASYCGADGLLKTAAINELRFVYDPITHALMGLLIEAATTNLLTYSEDFTNPVWARNGLTVTENAATSPDGTATADFLTETSLLDYHRIVRNVAGSVGAVRRFSVYAKAGGRTKARGWSWSGGDTSQQSFDLANGTCSGTQNPTIENVGGGWYRCSFNVPAPHVSVAFGPSDGAVNNNMYIGDGASGIYVWGAQFEDGAESTSYIQSTSAPVARAADYCTIFVDQTTTERHAALHARLTTLGGQNAAYFIALAESLGYTITITEFHLHTVEDDVDYPLYAAPWQCTWQVNAPQYNVGQLSVIDSVDDPLAWWGNEILECVFNRLKPANTHVLFAYL